METYQAKPTRYHKGFYRSRTEARWAVCWDTWGLRYNYEEEDVYLAAMKKRYLPDFYTSILNGMTSYIEIKGKKPSSMEVEKCEALCQQSGNPVLLIDGGPWQGDYGITVFYPDYDVIQCHWCGRLIAWEETHCPNCNNWLYFDYYEPSRVVSKANGIFGEFALSDSTLISVHADKYLPLHGGSVIPLSRSRIWQGFSSLYFGFRLARFAHFEYIRNQVPGIYQGECVAVPASFQVQDWVDSEWLYYAFCCTVPLDLLESLTEWGGVTPVDFCDFYEHYHSGLVYYGPDYAVEIWGDIKKRTLIILSVFDYVGRKKLVEICENLLVIIDKRCNTIDFDSFSIPGFLGMIIQHMVLFDLILLAYGNLATLLYPHIGVEVGTNRVVELS